MPLLVVCLLKGKFKILFNYETLYIFFSLLKPFLEDQIGSLHELAKEFKSTILSTH